MTMTPPNASVSTTPMPQVPAGTPPVEDPNTPPVTPDQEQTPPETPPAAPEPIIPENLDLDAPTLQETGIKAFDQIGKLMADKKVANADGILKELMETGELSLTSTAELTDKLGETVASMVLAQIEQTVGGIKETAKAERSRVLDYAANKFGDDPAQSDEVWKGIQDFVKSKDSGFSEADRKAMTTMIANGGMQAELVIDRIHAVYEKSSGFTQEADLLTGDTYSASSFTPVSKAEYTSQMREIVNTHGYNSRQADDLRAKRSASQARGY